mmetsp:Transcript_107161/g.298463  ORF Transcript_107161/g.298463 Transcript_107161/m.298463 type:complete len:227 (+) Transcript_107161:1365-2045(+)
MEVYAVGLGIFGHAPGGLRSGPVPVPQRCGPRGCLLLTAQPLAAQCPLSRVADGHQGALPTRQGTHVEVQPYPWSQAPAGSRAIALQDALPVWAAALHLTKEVPVEGAPAQHLGMAVVHHSPTACGHRSHADAPRARGHGQHAQRRQRHLGLLLHLTHGRRLLCHDACKDCPCTPLRLASARQPIEMLDHSLRNSVVQGRCRHIADGTRVPMASTGGAAAIADNHL